MYSLIEVIHDQISLDQESSSERPRDAIYRHTCILSIGSFTGLLSNATTVPYSYILQLVEIGVTMMDYAPGPHFTFIDPRLALVKLGHGERDTSDRPSNTTSLALQVIVEHAKELLTKFVTAGVDQSRVTIGVSGCTFFKSSMLT